MEFARNPAGARNSLRIPHSSMEKTPQLNLFWEGWGAVMSILQEQVTDYPGT